MSVFLFRIKGPPITRMTGERCDGDVWTGTFAHECSVNHSWSNLRRVRSAICGGSITPIHKHRVISNYIGNEEINKRVISESTSRHGCLSMRLFCVCVVLCKDRTKKILRAVKVSSRYLAVNVSHFNFHHS
jgi:hypothetical protein